nr:hypothetical protein BaRGS_004015 [Batillaria attramentaria]
MGESGNANTKLLTTFLHTDGDGETSNCLDSGISSVGQGMANTGNVTGNVGMGNTVKLEQKVQIVEGPVIRMGTGALTSRREGRNNQPDCLPVKSQAAPMATWKDVSPPKEKMHVAELSGQRTEGAKSDTLSREEKNRNSIRTNPFHEGAVYRGTDNSYQSVKRIKTDDGNFCGEVVQYPLQATQVQQDSITAVAMTTWRDVSPTKVQEEGRRKRPESGYFSNDVQSEGGQESRDEIDTSLSDTECGRKERSNSTSLPTEEACFHSSDYFYEDEFSVQFDTNLRDAPAGDQCTAEEELILPHSLNGSYTKFGGLRDSMLQTDFGDLCMSGGVRRGLRRSSNLTTWKQVKNLRKLGKEANLHQRSRSLPDLTADDVKVVRREKTGRTVESMAESFHTKRHSAYILELYQQLLTGSNPPSPTTLGRIDQILFQEHLLQTDNITQESRRTDNSTQESRRTDCQSCQTCTARGRRNLRLDFRQDAQCGRSQSAVETEISPHTLTLWYGQKNFSSQFPPNTSDCGVQTSVTEEDEPTLNHRSMQTSPASPGADLIHMLNQLQAREGQENKEVREPRNQKRDKPAMTRAKSATECHDTHAERLKTQMRRTVSLSPSRIGMNSFYTHQSLPDLSFLSGPSRHLSKSRDSTSSAVSLFDPVQIPIVLTPVVDDASRSSQSQTRSSTSRSSQSQTRSSASSGCGCVKDHPNQHSSHQPTRRRRRNSGGKSGDLTSSGSNYSLSSSSGIDPGGSEGESSQELDEEKLEMYQRWLQERKPPLKSCLRKRYDRDQKARSLSLLTYNTGREEPPEKPPRRQNRHSIACDDTLINVIQTAEALVRHFAQARDPFDKVRLGSAEETPEVGAIVVTSLCPAIERVVRDGMKPFLTGLHIFGKIHLSPWRMAESSAEIGPYTRAINDLVKQLKSRANLVSHRQKFYAFLAGLLNLRLLDFWMGYISSKESIVGRFYEDDAILCVSRSRLEQKYQDVLLALQPLAVLPFQIDYDVVASYSLADSAYMGESDFDPSSPKKSDLSSSPKVVIARSKMRVGSSPDRASWCGASDRTDSSFTRSDRLDFSATWDWIKTTTLPKARSLMSDMGLMSSSPTHQAGATGFSDTGNSATGFSDTGNSATGFSDTGNSATGFSDTGNSATGFSDTGNSATGFSNTGNSATGFSNTGNSATGFSNTGNSATGFSDTSNSATGFSQRSSACR